MTSKKSYNRYFIIFQEEDKGYGIAIDKQPTGYTKIETRNGRCKVTVYAQNLVKEKGPYVCWLIDATKSPVVVAKLGTIAVDDTGRGETWWEYREEDVADTGIPVDRFNVAAVVAEGDELRAPLAGYIGRDKMSWKDKIAQPAEPVFEDTRQAIETEELDEEAKKFEEYEEMIKTDSENEEPKGNENIRKEEETEPEEVEEIQESDDSEDDENESEDDVRSVENDDDNKDESESDESMESSEEDKENEEVEEPDLGREASEDEQEEQVDEILENEEDIETMSGFDEAEYEDIIADVANIESQFDDLDYRDDINDFNEDDFRSKKRKKRKHASMFHEVLKHFKEIDNPMDDIRNVRWWKIPHSEEIPIRENHLYPYFCSIYHLKMTYPYINYIKYYRKTGYYYFGIKYDDRGEVKYIMYGIEGRNSTLDQPYMGMTGFTKWNKFKCKDKDKGIWVMYYNPYTGCIMVPKKR